MIMKKNILASAIVALALAAVPFLASAATTAAKTPFYYGAWIPYWTGQAGEQQVSINLDSLNEVSPFSYELVGTGTIQDDLGIDQGLWTAWIQAVQSGGMQVIPTVAWFDTNGIYNLLSNTKARQAEETSLAQLAKTNDFNGIDIDFEAMSTSTRPYYSLFIEGLSERLHSENKVLTCSVVPRDFPSAVYTVVPPDLTYAEDYPILNQYCDEVRLEAYDQGTTDLQLDATKGGDGQLYAPVADPAWTTKIIQYALQYINPKKIMLGVPTYGYEYEVSWNDDVTTYQEVRAWDYFGAMDRAASLGITPVRDNAGELSFTFTSSTYIQEPLDLTNFVSSTEPPVLDTVNPNASTTFFVTFPDATSEMQMVDLAKQYGLRGVMFFKMDGDIDPAIWTDISAAQ